MATAECPHCGATFDARRLACPECGSDAETGWKNEEEIDYQSIEIPDYYEDPAAARAARRVPLWIVVAALLALLAMGLFVFGR